MSFLQTAQRCWQICRQRVSQTPAWFALGLCGCAFGQVVGAADGPVEVRSAPTEGSLARTAAKKLAGIPTAPAKVTRYAERLIEKYDLNHDGVLQKDEWMAFRGHPDLIDTNRDGIINLNELTSWIADYGHRKRIGIAPEPDPAYEQLAATPPTETPRSVENTVTPDETPSTSPATATPPLLNGERRRDAKFFVPSNRLPPGLPEWFIAKDLDGDGQLTVGEYSPTANSQELADFAKLDANGDGVMTARECVGKPVARSTKKSADSGTDPGSNDPGQTPAKPGRSRKKSSATQ